MDFSSVLCFLIFNHLSEAAWYPPGLRGDMPPWAPGLQPIPPPWSAPPPSAVFRRPMDAMVDLTNDLGVAILQDYSHMRSNFAFSPYGLASVLVVLYEGTMGESARQIHMAAKFPWDRDITRIGFRDIHRHLRSYFSHEGYLSGITLNKNRSTLKPDYKQILRFYGYDVDIEPPRPVSTPETSTKMPMVEVPIVTKPQKTTEKPIHLPSTTASVEVKETLDVTEQTIILNIKETTLTTSKTPETSSFSSTLTAKEITSTEEIATTVKEDPQMEKVTEAQEPTTVVKDNGMLVPQLQLDQTTTSTPDQDAVTEIALDGITVESRNGDISLEIGTTEGTEILAADSSTPGNDDENSLVEKISTLSPPENSDSSRDVSAENLLVTGSTENSELEEELTTQEFAIPTEGLENFPSSKELEKRSPPQWNIRTIDEYFLGNDFIQKSMAPPQRGNILFASHRFEHQTLEEYFLKRKNEKGVNEEESKEDKKFPAEWTIRTLDEYFLGNDLARKSSEPAVRDFVISTKEEFYPKTLEEFFLRTEVKHFPQTLDEYLLYRQARKSSPINYKTDLAFRRFATRRKARTITDMLHLPAVPELSLQLQNGMFDSHVSRRANLYRPLPRRAFLVDASAETPVPVMTYTNVFPYAYIPRLHSTALEFPLDDERYKLLLILPNERRGLRQLTYDLSQVTLRGVMDALRPARVRATVPTFMVEGFVILTPALQRLGIWNVFDPRRANLSAMSSDPELYVRNIEQSVTVVIRNYVEILDIQTRTMAARAVEHEFIATHPFLYFILDSETNVALMAGQMLDPMNSRVY